MVKFLVIFIREGLSEEECCLYDADSYDHAIKLCEQQYQGCTVLRVHKAHPIH